MPDYRKPVETAHPEQAARILLLTHTDLLAGPGLEPKKMNRNVVNVPELVIEGLLDGSIRQPIRALSQIAGDPEAIKPSSIEQSPVRTIATIIGSTAPFTLLTVLSKAAAAKILGANMKASLSRHVFEQACSGFAFGAVLTPSDLSGGDELPAKRLWQGASSALTFATMSGISGSLNSKLMEAGKRLNFAERGTVAAISGAAGGLVDAKCKYGSNASTEELITSAAGFALFGTAMEGLSYPIAKFGRTFSGFARASSAVESPAKQPQFQSQRRSGSSEDSLDLLTESQSIETTQDGSLENLLEKSPSTYAKGFRFLPEYKLLQRREAVLQELADMDRIGDDDLRFRLHPVMTRGNLISDAQKVRIINTLCQVNHLQSQLKTAHAKSLWKDTIEDMANTIYTALNSSRNKQAPDPKHLEEQLLVDILRSTRKNRIEGISEKEKEAAAGKILKHAGYSPELISRIEEKLSQENFDFASRKINLKDEDIAAIPVPEESACKRDRIAVAAGLPIELERFREQIADYCPEYFPKTALLSMRLRFDELSSLFLEREIDERSKSSFFHELNRMLEADNAKIKSLAVRLSLAEQVLNHAARPSETIHQGAHNTCNVTTCENRIYTRTPHIMAKLIADLAIDGCYVSPGKKRINLVESLSGLDPDGEARKSLNLQTRFERSTNTIKFDGDRDWSSQLAQTVFAKLGQSGRSYYLHKNAILNEDQLCFDKNFHMLQPIAKASLEPVYNDRAKVLNADEAGKALQLYRKDGNYIQELSQEQIIYDEYGHVKGCVANSELAKPLLDAFGKRIGDLKDGQFGFDEGGKILLHKVSPCHLDYDLIQTPGGSELERLHTKILGQRVYIRELEKGRPVLIDSPYLGSAAYQEICQELTNQENLPITIRRGDSSISGAACVVVDSPHSLDQTLGKFQEKGNMPCILVVDTRNPPWKSRHGGPHVVNVQEYDATKRKVKITNQWGVAANFMKKPLSLEDLFQSMKNRD